MNVINIQIPILNNQISTLVIVYRLLVNCQLLLEIQLLDDRRIAFRIVLSEIS
jgi:hypothetical protein